MTTDASDEMLQKGLTAPVTQQDRALVVWLLQKLSSLTYVRRLFGLYSNFVGGYENFVRREPSPWLEENLVALLGSRATLSKGIDQILAGYKSGYSLVRHGLEFHSYLTSRRFEGGLEHEMIGFRLHGPSVGLYGWARQAMEMAWRSRKALDGSWAFPGILQYNQEGLAADRELPALLRPHGSVIRTGEDVKATGIWMPASANACPAFLLEGDQAPPSQHPVRRAAKDWVIYESKPESWQLLWEDDRYPNGQVPDESSYLDSTTEPPPWPPEHPQPTTN